MLGFCCSVSDGRSQRAQSSTQCQMPCCCQPDVKLVPLRMQPSIVFERIVMLPSPCDVTVTVETLDLEDQIHSCHQLVAQQTTDDSFSWPEAVRFEVKSATAIVIKVQVKPKSSKLIAWLTGSNTQQAFHASTKRLLIQDLQNASMKGVEHFSFDLADSVSAMVIGKVILKSPLQNTMIRSMPLDPAYQTQPGLVNAKGTQMANGATMMPMPLWEGGLGTNANVVSMMPVHEGAASQYSTQTRAPSQKEAEMSQRGAPRKLAIAMGGG
eukprot:gnl/MRDRNA2_/MRDRNA2_28610_c0_seq1.p2 gnl/MRDRNA2_/MRDRNA2_28610_c0~~gnl/MRDRNA2_/MRDRNA2_28610_c0_seq1.p2  ORF type:complete len:268 (+),score=32.49 gnl/MRDRNA2_/MRDRNA2_28610_c0_seq1:92-895(+)